MRVNFIKVPNTFYEFSEKGHVKSTKGNVKLIKYRRNGHTRDGNRGYGGERINLRINKTEKTYSKKKIIEIYNTLNSLYN